MPARRRRDSLAATIRGVAVWAEKQRHVVVRADILHFKDDGNFRIKSFGVRSLVVLACMKQQAVGSSLYALVSRKILTSAVRIGSPFSNLFPSVS